MGKYFVLICLKMPRGLYKVLRRQARKMVYNVMQFMKKENEDGARRPNSFEARSKTGGGSILFFLRLSPYLLTDIYVPYST